MNKINLCDDYNCTQCYACQSICPKRCITLKKSKDGFYIPFIDRDICVECGACMNVCHKITPYASFHNPIKVYACWSKRLTEREMSSSGGAFSVIARNVLDKGGIVYGACMCEDLIVRHIAIDKIHDLYLIQGSKYVQSFLGDTYKHVTRNLTKGKLVLFSGTPCQVAGLYSFLHKKYENLYTCDVICHGVPSQTAFDIYINKINLRGKCQNFSFRFTKGWGFQLSRQKNRTSNKRVLSPRKTYYLRAFTKGLMFCESCYSCIYAKPERVSDFTLGDFWGIGEKIPFNYPMHKGISCLLINTEKALQLCSKLRDLILVERSLEEAVEGNYNLNHVSDRPKDRDTYFNDSQYLSIDELSEKYKIKACVRDYLRLLKQAINSFI